MAQPNNFYASVAKQAAPVNPRSSLSLTTHPASHKCITKLKSGWGKFCTKTRLVAFNREYLPNRLSDTWAS